MSAIVYPGTIDTFTPIPAGTTQDVAVGGRQHLDMHNDADAAIVALETKAGAGALNQTPTGGAVLTGLTNASSEWLPAYQYRNKLRNGRMNVAQRGTTPVPTPTDNLYGLDGWRVLMENASGVTVTQDTADVPTGAKYATKMVVGAGNNGKFGIFQVIANDDMIDMVGDVGSLQVKLKATAGIINARAAIVQWTGTADATTSDPVTTWGADGTNPTLSGSWAFASTPVNLNPTTAWATYKVAENTTISGSATNLAVLVWNDDRTTTQTTDILRIADVQLERGKVCTDIEKAPQGVEQLRCEVHCVVEKPGSGNLFTGWGQAATTTRVLYQKVHRVRMRAVPTLFTGGASATDYLVNDTNTFTVASVAPVLNVATRDLTRYQVDVASGLTQFRAYEMTDNSTGNAYVGLTAEI